jgi:predicted nucleic acid-binding protein
MKAFYLDAAYLCKLYWQEPDSEAIIKQAALADVIMCGLHGRAEFCSIGHRKVREEFATPSAFEAVLKQFSTDCAADALQFLPITPALVTQVEKVYLRASKSVFLRAADALHLACAAENGFAEIYSNDKHLLAAAPLFGLRGIELH